MHITIKIEKTETAENIEDLITGILVPIVALLPEEIRPEVGIFATRLQNFDRKSEIYMSTNHAKSDTYPTYCGVSGVLKWVNEDDRYQWALPAAP